MNRRRSEVVLRLLGVGWYVGICIGMGGIGGRWLDQQADLTPVFTLLGLGLGILLAFAGMYRMLVALLTEDTESDAGRGD